MHQVLHTKDLAPGPDDLPYALWRHLPEITLQLPKADFQALLCDLVLGYQKGKRVLP